MHRPHRLFRSVAILAATLLAASLVSACAEDTARSAQGADTQTSSDTSTGADTSSDPDAQGSDATTSPDADNDATSDDATTSPDADNDAATNADADNDATTSPDADNDATTSPDADNDATDPDASDDDATPDVVDPLPDPSGNGPQAQTANGDVLLDDRTFADLKGTVCRPADESGAPYPLVIISPGFSMNREQYRSYCEHLATWGFVAVVQTYQGITHNDYADNIGDIIDWAISPASGLSIDPDKVATAGHSLGGKVSILAAVRDSRVKAVVAWDPVDANFPSVAPEQMDSFSVPLAILGETLDSVSAFPPLPACAPADNNYTAYFNAASSRPVLAYTLAEADHMDWVDDPSCTLCGTCRPGEADHLEVKAITRRTTVAFLKRHLMADTSFDTYTIGAAALADEAAGVWTIQSR
jgi:dienelactone hydrolase